MIAIILAAGSGKRLAPLTIRFPKALVPLPFGETPLDILLATLRTSGISEIFVVRSDPRIAPIGCTIIEEDGRGNMVRSLMCALGPIEQSVGDVLVCYADLLLEQRLIHTAVSVSPGADIAVLADSCWEPYYRWRFMGGIGDAESFSVDPESGLIQSIGQPLLAGCPPSAQYIGVLRLSRRGLRLIADQYRQDNDPNIFMTTVLQHLIDGGESVAPVYVKNGWLELDTRSDYDTAVSVLAGTMASSVFDPTQVVGYPGG